jgi:hypothetical protein
LPTLGRPTITKEGSFWAIECAVRAKDRIRTA